MIAQADLVTEFFEAAKAQYVPDDLRNFEISQLKESEYLVVAHAKKNLKDMLMKFIPCMSHHDDTACTKCLTIVKFRIYVESGLVKKFEFEGLRGSPKLILQTFEELKKRLKGGMYTANHRPKWKSYS
jgi:hypothetical protein